MDSIKKFLSLIQKGDNVTILSEENVVEILNKLFLSELIEFKDGEIFLTEKGMKFIEQDEIILPIYQYSCYETGFL